MKSKLVVAYAIVILSMALFLPEAHARSKGWIEKARIHCVDQPPRFFLQNLLFGGKPQPNGCAPPVFQNGEYIGQDPDLHIRFQLFRDPDTGYTTRD